MRKLVCELVPRKEIEVCAKSGAGQASQHRHAQSTAAATQTGPPRKQFRRQSPKPTAPNQPVRRTAPVTQSSVSECTVGCRLGESRYV